MLLGLTAKDVQELVPYAKSWISAPELSLKSDSFVSRGYDKTQLAYVIQAKSSMNHRSLRFTLKGSEDAPVYNPCFVIHGWKADAFELAIHGKKENPGRLYQFGKEKGLEGDYWVLWSRIEATTQIVFELTSIGR